MSGPSTSSKSRTNTSRASNSDLEIILHNPYKFSIDVPEEPTVIEHLLNQARCFCDQGFGDVKFVENPVSEIFYQTSQIDQLSQNIASSLTRRDVKKGDIILYSTHEVSVYLFMMGAWRIGGVMRAIYPEENAAAMTLSLTESNAKIFLIDIETLPEAQKAVASVPWPVEIIVSDLNPVDDCAGYTSLQELLDDDGEACPEEIAVDEEDPALILATSGTTGPSKGCVYSQNGVLRVTETWRLFIMGPTTDRVNRGNSTALIISKPTHVSALSIGFAMMAMPGHRFLLPRVVTKENIFKAVDKYKPDHVFGFPTYLLSMANDPEACKFDLSSVKYVFTGGTVIHPSFVNAMKEKLGVEVIVAFGMTECALFTCTRNMNSKKPKDVVNWPNIPNYSTGKLFPDVSLKVLDPETGNHLGPNQIGELCFKTCARIEGYWKRPEETAKTFVDDYIHTGDMGYFDENSFVFVVNRLKECFKYFNNHIVPSEVENVILGHPAVERVNVVGVPDPNGGDTIPRAFVILKQDAGDVSANEIRNFANEKLASYKRLRGGLFILKEMPLGKTGKVDTAALSKLPVTLNPEDV